jgi:Ubiquitin carboxyl-terminal hydrolase
MAETSPSSLVGFYNPALMCWLISLIQAFSGLSSIQSAVHDLSAQASASLQGSFVSIVERHIGRVAQDPSLGATKKAFDVALLADSLAILLHGGAAGMAIQDTSAHQDVQEGLSALIETLTHSSRACKTVFPGVSTLFQGEECFSTSCEFCHHVSISSSPSQCISVELKGLSVESCLKAYSGVERVPQYKCPQCSRVGFGKRWIRLKKSPRILAIQFKRFKNATEKLRAPIILQETLSIHQYAARTNVDSTQYKLSAAIVHHGPSIHGGHYTCLSKAGKQWVECNDDTITGVSKHKALECEAYLVFYELVPPQGVPTTGPTRIPRTVSTPIPTVPLVGGSIGQVPVTRSVPRSLSEGAGPSQLKGAKVVTTGSKRSGARGAPPTLLGTRLPADGARINGGDGSQGDLTFRGPFPAGTSGFDVALQYLCDVESPFSLEVIRRSPRQPPRLLPYAAKQAFGDCCHVILQVLNTLALDDHCRLRLIALFHTLPLLLLTDAQVGQNAPATNARIKKNCDKFMTGQWEDLYEMFLKANAKHLRQLELLVQRRQRLIAHVSQDGGGQASGDRTVAGGAAPPDKRTIQRAMDQGRAGNMGDIYKVLEAPGLARGPNVIAEIEALFPQVDAMQALLSAMPSLPTLNDEQKETILADILTPAALLKAVFSTKAGKAPDQFGWRSRELMAQLLLRKDNFASLYAQEILVPVAFDVIPADLRAILSGGKLWPLSKAPKEGVRPIGVGGLGDKLVAKIVLQRTLKAIVPFLSNNPNTPNFCQLGVGVPGGTEKIFMALALTGDPTAVLDPNFVPSCTDRCIIKCDAANAFGTCSRFPALEVLRTVPGFALAAQLMHRKYEGQTSFLVRGEEGLYHEIKLRTGFQQGDVFGSAMYALATHAEMGGALQEELSCHGFAYIDDVHIEGPLDKAWRVVDLASKRAARLGLSQRLLHLFVPKWASLDYVPEVFEQLQGQYPDSVLQLHQRGFDILGAPYGTRQFISDSLDSVITRLRPALYNIVTFITDGRLATQALWCANKRGQYMLRRLPRELTVSFAATLDQDMGDALGNMLRWPAHERDKPPYERALAQLTNPPAMGGLGFTRASLLVDSAYCAQFIQSLSWLFALDTQAGLQYSLSESAAGTVYLSTTSAAGTSTRFASQDHFLSRGWDEARECLLCSGGYNGVNRTLPESTPAQKKDAQVTLPTLYDLQDIAHDKIQCSLASQRSLTHLVATDPNPANRFHQSRAVLGGSDMDVERIKHLSQQEVCANVQDPDPLSRASRTVIPSLRNDKTKLRYSALGFVMNVAASVMYDSFPMDYWIVWLNMVLGLPIPTTHSRVNVCGCNQLLGSYGHHQCTCMKWGRAAPKRGHDCVVRAVHDLARTMGHLAETHPQIVPTHAMSDGHQGDILFERSIGGYVGILGDVTLAHPVTGTGEWLGADQVLAQRSQEKNKKHQDAYARLQLLFLPLVASTYAGMHVTFLQLLWFLADTPQAAEAVDVGEVRQAYVGAENAALRMRRMLFSKACGRLGSVIARATAGRILGCAGVGTGTIHPYARPQRSGWCRYEGTDPSLTDPVSLYSTGSARCHLSAT